MAEQVPSEAASLKLSLTLQAFQKHNYPKQCTSVEDFFFAVVKHGQRRWVNKTLNNQQQDSTSISSWLDLQLNPSYFVIPMI
jgi:hypothetical protein